MRVVRKGKKEFSVEGTPLEILRDALKAVSGAMTINKMEPERIVRTIFPSYNRATALGGHPTRRLSLFHGQNQSGKSALVLGIVESFRRAGHLPAIFDTEYGAENRWYNALAMGDNVLFKQPENMDELIGDIDKLLDVVRKHRKSGVMKPGCGMVAAIDTLTKLLPQEALEAIREEGIKRGYSVASMWISTWFKSLVPQVFKTDSTILLVVQERQNTDKKSVFDEKYVPTGGEAIKFDNSIRVHMRTPRRIKVDGKIVGMAHPFEVIKNKAAGVSFSRGSFFTSNGQGSCPLGFDIAREAVEEAEFRGCMKTKEGLHIIRVGDVRIASKGNKEDLIQKVRESADFDALIEALDNGET